MYYIVLFKFKKMISPLDFYGFSLTFANFLPIFSFIHLLQILLVTDSNRIYFQRIGMILRVIGGWQVQN